MNISYIQVSLTFFFQGDFEHPICAVMLGDARLAATFAERMLGR